MLGAQRYQHSLSDFLLPGFTVATPLRASTSNLYTIVFVLVGVARGRSQLVALSSRIVHSIVPSN